MMRGLPKRRRRSFGGLFASTPPPTRLAGRFGPRRKHKDELGFLSGLRRFDVRASRVRVLGGGPGDFYRELLSRCRRARSRVSLSALYLGTGEKERALVAALEAACRERPDLHVTVVLDGARGKRPDSAGQSSLSMLQPLLRAYPDRVQVTLFDRGHGNNALAEVLGVYHIKLFAVDDHVIASGANLSETYFVDRLDRNVRFHDAPLAKWGHELVETLARQGGDAGSDTAALRALCSPEKPRRRTVVGCWKKQHSRRDVAHVFPALQFGAKDIRLDERVMMGICAAARRLTSTSLTLSTAYLNPPPRLLQAISKAGPLTLLGPSDAAHGFAGAGGVKAVIPRAYAAVAAEVTKALHTSSPRSRVLEWQQHRGLKTFHAKGAWLFFEDTALSLICSSNWNQRSTERDVELSFSLLTKHGPLVRALRAERDAFCRASKLKATSVQKPPLWLRLVRYLADPFL